MEQAQTSIAPIISVIFIEKGIAIFARTRYNKVCTVIRGVAQFG